jgi:transposase
MRYPFLRVTNSQEASSVAPAVAAPSPALARRTDWQERARAGARVEVRRFAEGLARDQAAVQAALEVQWSNGPVEGHINRLKTIKRQS